MIAACSFCGRDNDSGSRFCIDCGKPLDRSGPRANLPLQQFAASGAAPAGASGGAQARPSSSPGDSLPRAQRSRGGHDGGAVPHTRVSSPQQASCPRCTRQLQPGDLFCSRCGSQVASRVSVDAAAAPSDTLVFAARPHSLGPRLALLDEHGEIATVFTLERGEAVIGRGEADIRFSDDAYMSPLHARLEMRAGTLWLRDLGSRNLSWAFIDETVRLSEGDMLLVGSQVVRFRRLGFPGPHAPDVDFTRRMGSLTPSADVAVLEQLRADGSVRDTLHLSPGRNVVLGRESGDWLFPYDQTMSGRHAEVRSEDAAFFVRDVGSRNGVALAVRGERPLKAGQRLLLGDQIMRVEST